MSLPSGEELVKEIRDVLNKVEQLDTYTQRQLRTELETRFKTDLSSMKAFIKEKTAEILAERANEDDDDEGEEEEGEEGSEEGEEEDGDEEEESEEEEEDSRPAKKKGGGGGFNKEWELSPVMSEFLGVTHLSRPQITKRLWAYIKEHDLQDPSNRQNIMCDGALQKVFKVKSINMLQMSRAVGEHILGGGTAASTKRTSSSPAKSGSTKRKSGSSSKGGEKKPRVQKKQKLSEELQAVLGCEELARTETVKYLWKYIKENNLQNPNDGRQILCDQKLKAVFRQDKLTCFQMSKLLQRHFLGPA